MLYIILAYAGALLLILIFFKLIRIVPEQESYIVEQLGKYRKTLGSGLHFVIPLIQKIADRHSLKEEVIDVEPQMCITKDNVQVLVDGILYFRITDPVKASYGIEDYRYAIIQLAKTTMRSGIGKLDLDKTFSERENINDNIVKAIDEASDPWGIKVTRYEIKDITPNAPILKAMEQQMRAEREKRAEILKSEGDKEYRINISKGERQEAINISLGEKTRKINEAEGKARAIEVISTATAKGLALMAKAIQAKKGKQAMNLRITEQYIRHFGEILENSQTDILPMNIAQLKTITKTLFPALAGNKRDGSENGPNPEADTNNSNSPASSEGDEA